MSARRTIDRAIMIVALMVAITAASTHLTADTGTCGGEDDHSAVHGCDGQ
jgi:hypothetical protein